MTKIRSPKDLVVYQKAYNLAMEIFKISKTWPKEERYSLTDQIRRSSRSVCSNLSEAWGKRRYKAHFIKKLTDSDSENLETISWLNFAYDCEYLNKSGYNRLINEANEISRMLNSMLFHPVPFLLQNAPN